MFTKTLLPDTFRAIKLISNIPIITKAYLAGGTALALHLGHRISIDLDFFTKEVFDEQLAVNDLSRLTEFKKEQTAWRTVIGTIGETKFSLFFYKYQIIDPLENFEGIKILSKKDMSAMKIHAIEDRGTKRDFIDTFFLAKEYSLEQMFEFYNLKYGSLDERLIHIVKSLAYFDDAEHDDWQPRMLIPVDWEEIKAFFRQETQRLAKSMLGFTNA